MSNSPQLNLVVIRSSDPARLVAFYELLGMVFREERHGNGPLHWATSLGNAVFEIYPSDDSNSPDLSTRLGFVVADAAATIASMRQHSVRIVGDFKPTPWGLRAVIKDPDGRSVELVQVVAE